MIKFKELVYDLIRHYLLIVWYIYSVNGIKYPCDLVGVIALVHIPCELKYLQVKNVLTFILELLKEIPVVAFRSILIVGLHLEVMVTISLSWTDLVHCCNSFCET
jgi:hypothetical protein